MFGELLESRAKRVRNRGGTVASAIGHGLFIALAVAATRSPLIARGPAERVVPLPVLTPAAPAPTPNQPAPSAPTSRTSPSVPLPPRPIDVVFAPVEIPDGITTDLVGAAVEGIAWRSDNAGALTGTAGNAGSGVGTDIPFAEGVDKPAMAISGNPAPRYPDILRRANVAGEVVIQVVIDTTGRADMSTVRVVSSAHTLLTDAVLAVLPKARFLPAETRGRKVPMWAVQSFVFEVR
jgi:TonB family protein